MKKTILENGLTIISKENPYSYSATISYSVNAGSYDEKGFPIGTAHFVEHMLSKGTTFRTNRKINEDISFIGGEMNAFTTYDETKYYCDVPFDQWESGLEILSDIFWNPLIPLDEIIKERNVIIEEIKSYNDDPQEFLMDHFMKKIHKGYKERQSITGTIKTVKSINRDDLISFINKYYNANNTLIVATGNVKHEDIVKFMTNYNISRKKYINIVRDTFIPNKIKSQYYILEKDVSQSHYVFGLFSPTAKDIDRYTMDVITSLLAGDMSSRLYRIIREEKGLVYGLEFDSDINLNNGITFGYIALERENIEEAQKIIFEQLKLLKLDFVEDLELQRTKNFIRGDFLRGYDNNFAINNYISSNFINLNSLEVNDYIENINKVTKEDILRVSNKYFNYNNYLHVQLNPINKFK